MRRLQKKDLETQIPPIVERSSQNWIWLIGLSITAGVILLIILVGVLWCCGFFKRYRPQYPISTLVDPPLTEGHYYLASSPKPGQYPGHDDHEETLSDMGDNQMMIQNPVDSFPIVVPQHSSHFIQQQHHPLKRSQFSN
ncbi:unnamed protein product [Rotaria magnacalcarata]|uniref:Uncharacterized protein n=1 Tax=Rotaria magnacalcarata TaxID=392030 RepID=A0A816JSX4_9BILA|nr:unnamed protein product [Rotaria magnacalcarata]CAF1227612.1 unnamed protein product [Rotaria magnacalcarata]CAF1902423.1 unnamed protein product [Rotaria magnacalcarata]CAF1929357.1 unnamed protein product [Rotaria magnacalcarata]CAF1962487.1 unnamed protein product [Rotaria magnacalcarata]